MLAFGPYRVDLGSRLLLRDDEPVALTPKAFDTLAVLVERPGEVVTKEELLEQVWPDTFVEEATLTQNVYTLRKALAEAASEQEAETTYIETIPRRGYRFAAEVTPSEAPAGAAPPAGGAAAPAPAPPAFESSAGARRGLWLALAALGVAVAAVLWLLAGLGADPEPVVPAGISSIAVLPFVPLADDPDDAYLGLGMADALIGRLSNLDQLAVRPTSAVRRYTGERDALAVGRELGVDAVLDGTLQRDGDRVRVSAQLIGVAAGAPLWAVQLDPEPGSVFELQDSLSQRLADELRLRLTRRQRELLTRHGTDDPDAYLAYVRGRYFWNRRTAAELDKAIESFRRAIEIDPAYALAYSGLADCYVLLPLYGGVPPRRALPLGIAAAERALELDDSLAEAHTSLAYARFVYDRRWADAEAGFRRALALNSRYPTAHHWYSFLLAARGRHDEALAEIERARELDPLSLVINTDLGMVLYFSRRYDEAVEQFERTIELDPDFAYARFGLGLAHLAAERPAAAVGELEQAVELAPDSTAMRAALGQALATAGDEARARSILAALQEQEADRYVEPSHLAFLYVGLGDTERALAALARASDERSRFVAFLETWPIYDPLRGAPGWDELVARVGL